MCIPVMRRDRGQMMDSDEQLKSRHKPSPPGAFNGQLGLSKTHGVCALMLCHSCMGKEEGIEACAHLL